MSSTSTDSDASTDSSLPTDDACLRLTCGSLAPNPISSRRCADRLVAVERVAVATRMEDGAMTEVAEGEFIHQHGGEGSGTGV